MSDIAVNLEKLVEVLQQHVKEHDAQGEDLAKFRQSFKSLAWLMEQCK